MDIEKDTGAHRLVHRHIQRSISSHIDRHSLIHTQIINPRDINIEAQTCRST